MPRSKRRLVTSRFGWPVERAVRRADPDQMDALLRTASTQGFSRCGEGLNAEGAVGLLFPFLYEGTPEPSWICMVVQLDGGFQDMAMRRPTYPFSTLDVRLKDFAGLPRLKRRDREQLLHWMAVDLGLERLRPASTNPSEIG